MERLLENTVKTALMTKLFVWALVTLIGAFCLAISTMFNKPESPDLNHTLMSEDPYSSPDGNIENSRALRYL
jgi:Na+/proline symporter